MHLLIVDDEAQIIQGIMNGIRWELLDFEEIMTAKSYEQAQEIFRNSRVDILLSDIEMSDKSGLDLIAWVNQEYPDTECIILSCHDEFDYARRAVCLKCLSYGLKPVPYEILTEELWKAAEAVRQKHSQTRLENYGRAYMKQISDSMEPEESEDILGRATAYIKEHLSEDISVEALAKEVHVSPRHLGRLFKKEFDRTVSDYILTQKMMLAANLLQNTRLSVTMVADKAGYTNYSYFIRLFRKFYGMTPREYQLKMQNRQKEHKKQQ